MLDKLIEAGEKYDLVLTDPPYNINKDFGNDSDKLPLDEFVDLSYERICKLKKILTPTGSIIWFGRIIRFQECFCMQRRMKKYTRIMYIR